VSHETRLAAHGLTSQASGQLDGVAFDIGASDITYMANDFRNPLGARHLTDLATSVLDAVYSTAKTAAEAKATSAGTAQTLLSRIESDSFVDDTELLALQTLCSFTELDDATRERLALRMNERVVGIGEAPSPFLASSASLQCRVSRPLLANAKKLVSKAHDTRSLSEEQRADKRLGFFQAITGDTKLDVAARSKLSDDAAVLHQLKQTPAFPGPDYDLVTRYRQSFGIGESLADARIALSGAFQSFLETRVPSDPAVFEAVRDELAAHPSSASHLPFDVQNNAELWSSALNLNPSLADGLPPLLWDNSIVLDALRNAGDERDLLSLVPLEATLDPVVVQAAQPKDHRAYNVSIAEQAAALNRDAPDEYASFLSGLKRTNIHATWRFTDLNALRQIIATRLQSPSLLVPSVVWVDATPDHNSALDNGAQNAFESVRNTHALRYYQGHMYRALREALNEHRTNGVPVSKLVLFAHGSPTHLGNIHGQDIAELLKANADLFPQGAEILLLGCSVGAGGETADNVVNKVADAVPHVTVRGATTPLVDSPVSIEDGKLSGGIPWYEREHVRSPR
jgi:hypothetical protein